MKKRMFVMAILFYCMGLHSQDTLKWQMRHPLKKNWIDAGSHGSVQELLMKTGELPDPYFGENESLFAWVEEHKWEFHSSFMIEKSDLENFIFLNLPYVDLYADIYINDSLICQTENAFRPYVLNVSALVRSGMNTVRVVFTPPVLYHEKTYKDTGYKLPAPNDVHKIAVAPYCRKPQYQFGWDWALRMNTMGMLKPVTVHRSKMPMLLTDAVQTLSVSKEKAQMLLQLEFNEPLPVDVTMQSEIFGSFTLKSGQRSFRFPVELENPQLWWPAGQGDQYLYADNWYFFVEQDTLLNKAKRFGIRTSKLIVEPDKWGTSYVIEVNGRKIFCKGGDYIPQDIFPSRVYDDHLRNMVRQMRAANFNMVRVWGGGYYPDEAFFNACDEAGLMVWQDFMFACAMYPGDSSFLSNVGKEFDYQIPRISSHPSVVLFNGNNEVDVAWKNWGFQIRYSIYGKDAQEIEESYIRLFKEFLPEHISYWTTVPYVHTSPLSNWGKDEFYNHGSQHYWGVWHGKDPMEHFAKKIGRFNAEYGFQSFPEISTIKTFANENDLDLQSAVMKHHQKSYVGNGMIHKHAKNLFGESKDFREFIYYSQLTQAEAVGMAVSGHRLDAPRCMGTLFWQVNDCWPAPTWSSIDYFGQWKALHYRVRQDYEDVAVLCSKDDIGKPLYFLLSQQPVPYETELSYVVFNLKGKKIASERIKVAVVDGLVMPIKLPCAVSNEKEYVIDFSWTDPTGTRKDRRFSYAPSHERTTQDFVKWELTSIDTANGAGTITLYTDRFIEKCWIYAENSAIHLKENFIDFLPGVHKISFTFDALPKEKDIRMQWR